MSPRGVGTGGAQGALAPPLSEVGGPKHVLAPPLFEKKFLTLTRIAAPYSTVNTIHNSTAVIVPSNY